MKLSEYTRHWLYVKKRAEVKPGSFDALVGTFTRYVEQGIGEKELKEVTEEDVQVAVSDIQLRLSTSVAKKVYYLLKAVFEYAYCKGDVERNPVFLVKSPSYTLKPPEDVVVLTKEEVAKLYIAVDKTYSNGRPVYYYGYAFVLMLCTGVRPCELLGFKWCDVDFENRTISVRRNVVNFKNQTTGKFEVVVQNTLKTKKSKRTLYLNDTAIFALNKLKEYQITKSEYVVAGKDGSFLAPQQLRRTFYRMLDSANIPKHNLYSLRHTFATQLFAKGISLKTISEMLGHTSIRVTADTYVHLVQEVDESTLVLDSLFDLAQEKEEPLELPQTEKQKNIVA